MGSLSWEIRVMEKNCTLLFVFFLHIFEVLQKLVRRIYNFNALWGWISFFFFFLWFSTETRTRMRFVRIAQTWILEAFCFLFRLENKNATSSSSDFRDLSQLWFIVSVSIKWWTMIYGMCSYNTKQYYFWSVLSIYLFLI